MWKLLVQQKQNREFINYFWLAHRCLVISRNAGLHHTEQFLGKTNAMPPNVLPSSSLSVVCSAFFPPFSCGMEYPFGQFGPALLAVLLLTSGSSSAYLQMGQCEEQKSPWLCVNFAQQKTKASVCCQHCFLYKFKT